MRIKHLKISGFKSFCHPIEIEFKQHGITTIVGPNGCGKSNVVDALRWVLGEQSAKHLRGGAMEDVIFAGSSYQKPGNVAEVCLTFTNLEGDTLSKYHEYTEIEISRKLYRTGESIYSINKVPVRLMDIRDLFMDTGIGGKGYSIIEQGRVGDLISAKPTERRYIIEEVAGIMKFQAKRQQAEKRLAQTEQNLERVTDILQELERQESSLADQAQKAQSFKELQDDFQNTDQQLSTLRWQKAQKIEAEATAQHQALQEQSQALSEQKAIHVFELEKLSKQQAQQETQVQQLQQQVFQSEKSIHDAQNQKTLEEQNLLNHQEWIQKHTEELQELQAHLSQYETQLDDAKKQMHLLEKQESEFRKIIEAVEESKQVAEDEIFFINDEIQGAQKQLLHLHTQLTNQQNQRGFLEERLRQLDDRQARLQEQVHAGTQLQLKSTQQLESVQAQVQTASAQVQEWKDTLQDLDMQLQSHLVQQQELEQQTQTQKYEHQRTLSQLESLMAIQQKFEDFGDTTKAFKQALDAQPELREQFGVLGVLAEFVTIASEDLAKVSPILGDYLECVVLKNDQHLHELEAFFEEHELGRMGFLLLNQQASSSPTPKNLPGTPLSQWVRCAPEIHELKESLFQQIRFMDESHTWETLFQESVAAPAIQWVSAQGSRWDTKTVMMGKAQTASIGYLERQNQISHLDTAAQELDAQVQTLEASLHEHQQLRISLEEQHETARAQKHECELALLQHQKEQEHAQLEQQRHSQVLKQLEHDAQNLETEKGTHQQKIEELVQAAKTSEEQRVAFEQQIENHQEQLQVRRQQMDEITQDIVLKRVSLTESVEKLRNAQDTKERLQNEKSSMQERFRVLDQTKTLSHQNIDNSHTQIERLQLQIEQAQQGHVKAQQQLQQTSQELAQTQEEHQQKAASSQESQTLLSEITAQLHETELRITEHRMQREQMEEQLQNSYETSPERFAKIFDLSNLKESMLASHLKSLRTKLNQMENINLAAPEEYAQLQERMTFLQQQSEDLNVAMNDLRNTIREINVESRRRFKESFEHVNAHFKETFVTLFGGGSAYMQLTDSDDILEAGIEIIAQPPGKKLQNLNLLSGGEKALTAISLIFSIFLIKPSPFCLLDEVDAPLDDANVVRFNQLIQKTTSDSQFIIITHNKKTMEMGDLLYGVTMEEAGISKVVSVAFDEVHEDASLTSTQGV